jgi:hypothetical protein
MLEHKKQLVKQHKDLTKQIETEQAQKKATAEAAEVAKTKPKGIGSETTNVIG